MTKYRRRRFASVAIVGTAFLSTVGFVPPSAHGETTVRGGQWHLDALRVPEAHRISRGEGVIVAVVEGIGVDASHPDLDGQVLPGVGFGANASPTGWSDRPEAEHATDMAGIIVAKGGGVNNALGVAPAAKVLPVAVGGTTHRTSHEIAQGIRYAVDHRAKVINLSFGRSGDASSEEVEAVRYAMSQDVVVVAAAGNTDEGGSEVVMPANLPGVVAVSGVLNDGSFWPGSASGPEVTIGAPAVDIVSTAPKSFSPSGYQKASGTSEATAIVSGTVALIRARFPQLNAASVINRLILTARDQGEPGRDEYTGFGTVRVLDALTASVPEVAANPLGSPSNASSATSPAEGSGGESSRTTVLVVVVLGLGALVVVGGVIAVIVVASRKRPAPAVRPMTPGSWPTQPRAGPAAQYRGAGFPAPGVPGADPATYPERARREE